MSMDIRTYANAHGGFPRVAGQLGFNAEFLRQVAKGRRRVSPQNAIRIERATNGLVTRASYARIWCTGGLQL
ncbi:helix-turn-helix domain-containing protein, partial [Acidithiobacillus caldus]|nr:helix-turn-helix domain-containing protein [Acidithiobacillus caldus]